MLALIAANAEDAIKELRRFLFVVLAVAAFLLSVPGVVLGVLADWLLPDDSPPR